METMQITKDALAEITRLEDEYDALALVPDHRWGRQESDLLTSIVSRLSDLYEIADVPEFERIVL